MGGWKRWRERWWWVMGGDGWGHKNRARSTAKKPHGTEKPRFFAVFSWFVYSNRGFFNFFAVFQFFIKMMMAAKGRHSLILKPRFSRFAVFLLLPRFFHSYRGLFAVFYFYPRFFSLVLFYLSTLQIFHIIWYSVSKLCNIKGIASIIHSHQPFPPHSHHPSIIATMRFLPPPPLHSACPILTKRCYYPIPFHD
jgi:hypothetical protein